MSQQTFLIVGGTGTVGTPLVDELVKAGAVARIGTRDPTKANQTPPANGKVAVRLELQDPSTFDAALDGVDGVFVLSPPGHARQDVLLTPFLDAAAKRAPKIVTMTANGVQFDDNNPMRKIELKVAASGVRHVHLRPGWFMQNFQTFWLPTIQKDGVIALPAGDAKTAFVDARDIAGVAAQALLTSKLDGQALALTGPESLTYAEAAQILSEAAGRPITYLPVEDAAFHRALTNAGLPADYGDLMVTLFGTVRQGFAASVDDAVARVLGRARTLRQYAQDHAAVWRR